VTVHADGGPSGAMVEPAHRIVRFLETGDRSMLADVFTDDAVLLESVAPYVFEGVGGVDQWAERMTRHVGDHRRLTGTLGSPQEYSRDGDHAFFSIPLTWRFGLAGRDVTELGAMALMLRAGADGGWRVARYAWTVVSTEPA